MIYVPNGPDLAALSIPVDGTVQWTHAVGSPMAVQSPPLLRPARIPLIRPPHWLIVFSFLRCRSLYSVARTSDCRCGARRAPGNTSCFSSERGSRAFRNPQPGRRGETWLVCAPAAEARTVLHQTDRHAMAVRRASTLFRLKGHNPARTLLGVPPVVHFRDSVAEFFLNVRPPIEFAGAEDVPVASGGIISPGNTHRGDRAARTSTASTSRAPTLASRLLTLVTP